eukprot:1506419-Amphidinium_carterae.2
MIVSCLMKLHMPSIANQLCTLFNFASKCLLSMTSQGMLGVGQCADALLFKPQKRSNLTGLSAESYNVFLFVKSKTTSDKKLRILSNGQ